MSEHRRVNDLAIRSAIERGGMVACAVVALLVVGCRQKMTDQPRYEAYEGSSFFADGRSMRPPVEGAIARGALDLTGVHGTGKQDGKFVAEIPIEVERATVLRGRERFNIYCAPCHDQTGSGRGMIVLRGYPPPPSFHTQALRQAPAGQLFDVITNGYRQMPDYAAQVLVDDRWAIVAYIRALQLSQHATLDDVPADERVKLEGETTKPEAAPAAPANAPDPLPASPDAAPANTSPPAGGAP